MEQFFMTSNIKLLMSKKSDSDETDVEMGNIKNTMALCFDCIDEKNNDRDDASDQTLEEQSRKCDEDDLGDNEDEYKEEFFNSCNNKSINSNDDDYTKISEPDVDHRNHGKKDNDTCFDMNANFLSILEKTNVDSSDLGISMPPRAPKDPDSFDTVIKSDRDRDRELNDIAVLHNIEDFWEANSESEDEDYLDKNAKHPLEQISFEKLKKKVYKDFDVNLIHRYSSALDILASYIKYHVIIYTEASYYCNFKLNVFMVPAILFSTVCSIITGITHNNKNMAIIVASLNGFVAFLIAIINYLKLDASAEAHKISAYQYSKLKNYIEFSSGEILLFQDPIITNKSFISEQIQMWEKNNSVMYSDSTLYDLERNKKLKEFHKYKSHLEKKLIDTIQNKIFEIKKSLKNIEDNNNFILPKHINNRYYNIYNINVFSYIKSVENYKLILLNQLRNVKNEIRFYRVLEKNKNGISEDKMLKIKVLYKRKNCILTEFLELNKGFMLIDTMFQQEIKNINIRRKYWIVFKFQGFLKLLARCCCSRDKDINILPVGYKQCTHVGFVDENGRYLLDKILRSNNVLTVD